MTLDDVTNMWFFHISDTFVLLSDLKEMKYSAALCYAWNGARGVEVTSREGKRGAVEVSQNRAAKTRKGNRRRFRGRVFAFAAAGKPLLSIDTRRHAA